MMKNKIKPQTLLSTLWIFVLLNMVFRDLHQLGKKGFIEEIMTGMVNGIEITDELMLIGGILAEIPILMVLLSRILNHKSLQMIWTSLTSSKKIVVGKNSPETPEALIILKKIIERDNLNQLLIEFIY